MFGLDNPSGVSVMPPITPVSNPTPLWFTEGGAGLAVSYPGQEWFNIVQAELLAVLQEAGIKPDKSKLNQLAVAIKSIAAERGIELTDKLGNSSTLAASQKLVTEINDNANSKLAKSQNGADIPDKNAFVKNLGLAETVSKANNAVPSSRKVNGKALTGDVSLNAGDVGAISTYEAGFIGNNGKFQNFLATGFYRVGPHDLNTVSDFPRDSNNALLYSYGILEVQTSSETISQRYTSHIGQIAIRQTWDAGKTWHGWYVAYDNNSRDIITAGIPLPYPHRYTPPGYLTCNGQTFNKSVYPKLALAYPAGRVPDLRGEFIRGWDDSRGVDPGRVCGSWQGDAIQNITGSLGMVKGIEMARASGAFSAAFYNVAVAGHTNNTVAGGGDWTFDASRVVPTANENRPRNVAFNYIVRAI